MTHSRKTTTLLLSALLLAVVVLLSMNSLTAKADTSQTSDGDPFFGVIAQNPMSKDDFDLMEWGRMGSYRMPVSWESVEGSGDGDYDWGQMDHIVTMTASRGIKLLPTFYNSPSWLTYDKRRLPIWSGYAIGKWKDFLRAAVERYGNGGEFWEENPDIDPLPVVDWQLWNEPNIKFFAYPVSPRNYAKLLKISAPAIRSADPAAKVVTAGLYGSPPKGKGIDAGPYLNRLYKVKGFRKSFDVAAIHPYASTFRGSLERTWPIRRSLNVHHNRNKRIDITELGWGSDSATIFGKGSTSGQADEIRFAYRALLRQRNRLHLKSVYWFSWSDLPDNSRSCAFCFKTGLFDEHGNAKPAWYSMLDFTHGI